MLVLHSQNELQFRSSREVYFAPQSIYSRAVFSSLSYVPSFVHFVLRLIRAHRFLLGSLRSDFFFREQFFGTVVEVPLSRFGAFLSWPNQQRFAPRIPRHPVGFLPVALLLCPAPRGLFIPRAIQKAALGGPRGEKCPSIRLIVTSSEIRNPIMVIDAAPRFELPFLSLSKREHP